MYHIFINSCVDGNLDSFNVLAIVKKNAVMHIRVHVFFKVCFPPDICPEMGLMDHIVPLFFLVF